MLVTGPVNCGKSSLLARVEQRANQIGIETAWFDPWLPADQQEDGSSVAAAVLYEQLQDQWSLDPRREGPPDSIPRLFNWLKKALAPTASKPRLLILDDLASLGVQGAEEWSSQFARAMHNLRATGKFQVNLAVGLTYQFGPSFARWLMGISSVVHWKPRIELGWFTAQEAVDLMERIGFKSEPWVSKIIGIFDGHPYLMHAAATDQDFRDAMLTWQADQENDANKEVLRATKPYKRHLNAIRFAILGPTMQPGKVHLQLGHTFTSHGPGERDPDHMQFLTKAMLSKEDGSPRLSIYRLIREDLQRELH
jgi:hypothetical protein